MRERENKIDQSWEVVYEVLYLKSYLFIYVVFFFKQLFEKWAVIKIRIIKIKMKKIRIREMPKKKNKTNRDVRENW